MLNQLFNWRTTLAIIAIAIVTGTVFYSNYLSKKIASDEREKVDVWVQSLKTRAAVTDQASLDLTNAITSHNAPPVHFVWGVMAPLLAWVAIMMPAFAGLPLLGVILIACYFMDRRTWPAAGLGAWLTLRLHLTIVSSFSCFFAAGAT